MFTFALATLLKLLREHWRNFTQKTIKKLILDYLVLGRLTAITELDAAVIFARNVKSVILAKTVTKSVKSSIKMIEDSIKTFIALVVDEVVSDLDDALHLDAERKVEVSRPRNDYHEMMELTVS